MGDKNPNKKKKEKKIVEKATAQATTVSDVVQSKKQKN